MTVCTDLQADLPYSSDASYDLNDAIGLGRIHVASQRDAAVAHGHFNRTGMFERTPESGSDARRQHVVIGTGFPATPMSHADHGSTRAVRNVA
jgi:hypothetical protein